MKCRASRGRGGGGFAATPCSTRGSQRAGKQHRRSLDLVTPRERLYEIGNARLSRALNNTLGSVVRLTTASLGRLGNPAANAPTPWRSCAKAQIALVYAELEATRLVDRRMAAFVPKQTTEILVPVAGLRIRGRAHACGPLDPIELHRLAAQAGDRFVVLTDAGLAVDVEGTTERGIGVAMLNARHIQYVASNNEGAVVADRHVAAPPLGA